MSLGTEGPRIGSRWRPQSRHDDRLEIPGFPVDQNAGDFGEPIRREIKVSSHITYKIWHWLFCVDCRFRYSSRRSLLRQTFCFALAKTLPPRSSAPHFSVEHLKFFAAIERVGSQISWHPFGTNTAYRFFLVVSFG